ncbi:MAG: GAF domain-containing protein [Vicinamibacterales bacterium]
MADDALQQAHDLIARQAVEIDRLRTRLEGEQLAGQLRDSLVNAATAGAISAPDTDSRLLDTILTTAAHVIGGRSGALFVVDTENEELIFASALGPKADEVRSLRVPLGHGIAGLVAVSGQPMAVSDAGNDPRQAADIAATVDYIPQSILCVPLVRDEQVIGVLELLDKQSSPSFSPDDISLLSLFAEQAAAALEQSRAQRDLTTLVTLALRSWVAGSALTAETTERLRQFTLGIEQDAGYVRALDLAALVTGIASHGDLANDACRAILTGFLEYLQAVPRDTPGLDDLGFSFGGGD